MAGEWQARGSVPTKENRDYARASLRPWGSRGCHLGYLVA